MKHYDNQPTDISNTTQLQHHHQDICLTSFDLFQKHLLNTQNTQNIH